MTNQSLFQGWDLYPQNLPRSHRLQVYSNLELYHNRLQDDSQRLFDPRTPNIKIETIAQEIEQGKTVDSVTNEAFLEDIVKVSHVPKLECKLLTTFKKHLNIVGDHYMLVSPYYRLIPGVVLHSELMATDNYRLLSQNHSWAPFNNSETSLRKIFTAVQVRPTFLDILHEFGDPCKNSDAGHSGGYEMSVERSVESGETFNIREFRDCPPLQDRG